MNHARMKLPHHVTTPTSANRIIHTVFAVVAIHPFTSIVRQGTASGVQTIGECKLEAELRARVHVQLVFLVSAYRLCGLGLLNLVLYCIVFEQGTFGLNPNDCPGCETEGCVGGQACDIGYQGDKCVECASGYTNSAGTSTHRATCDPCNSNSTWMVALLIVGVFIFTIVLVLLNGSDKYRAVLQLFRICICYVQSKLSYGVSVLSLLTVCASCSFLFPSSGGIRLE